MKFDAEKPSLLLSVKSEVVAGCGDPLAPVLEPRDVWIRTDWNGRWLWRHVKSDEKFWEANGMSVACDDGNATDSVGMRWENYYDVAQRSVWVGPANRWFYASTGTMWVE